MISIKTIEDRVAINQTITNWIFLNSQLKERVKEPYFHSSKKADAASLIMNDIIAVHCGKPLPRRVSRHLTYFDCDYIISDLNRLIYANYNVKSTKLSMMALEVLNRYIDLIDLKERIRNNIVIGFNVLIVVLVVISMAMSFYIK